MPTRRGRNQLEQASGTMPRREKTKPKRACVRGDADIHRQLHGGADADGRTVDRGDDGLEAFIDRQRHAAAAVAHALVGEIGAVGGTGIAFGPVGALFGIEGVGAGRQIGAGAEAAALAGDDDGTDIVVRHSLS